MSKNLRGLSERMGLKTSLFKEIINVNISSADKMESLLNDLSEKSLIGKSSLLATGSFYDFLKGEHSDKKVFICDGTACLTSGTQDKLRKELLEKFREDQIGTVTCLGHCHSNHAFMYDHATYSSPDPCSVIDNLNSGKLSRGTFYTGTNADKPALLAPIGDLIEYFRVFGEFAENISGALKEIELSGLRGRGGAGFPFYVKLITAANTCSVQKFVVCNADEGDPGAFSDKWLLEERPHSVLFGMMMTGLITGAAEGVVYIRGEYPEAVTSVKTAIEQIEKEGLNCIKSDSINFNFRFNVVEGAGAYICGEETSLLNSIEGLRPEVRTRPPFPAQYGLFWKPTLLSNVETFANIRYILHEGGRAYASIGTEKSSGTKLVSLDGSFNNPGLYEVRMGTPLSVVLNEMGGGTKCQVKAFQIGGPLGGIVPSEKVKDLNLDFESFNEAGFLLGHAGIVSIPADFPMIKFLLHLFEFTSRESCGKCFPCRIGSDRGTDLISLAIKGQAKIDKELFSDLLETMQLGSLCALGGGLPLPVKNAIQYFSSELEVFFTKNTRNHD
jgi:NADH:ubiquinone oxidoreductase subunit F (NADH-binding)